MIRPSEPASDVRIGPAARSRGQPCSPLPSRKSLWMASAHPAGASGPLPDMVTIQVPCLPFHGRTGNDPSGKQESLRSSTPRGQQTPRRSVLSGNVAVLITHGPAKANSRGPPSSVPGNRWRAVSQSDRHEIASIQTPTQLMVSAWERIPVPDCTRSTGNSTREESWKKRPVHDGII